MVTSLLLVPERVWSFVLHGGKRISGLIDSMLRHPTRVLDQSVAGEARSEPINRYQDLSQE